MGKEMRSLTYTQKRLIAGILLVFIVFTTLNYFLDFGIFGRFAKLAAISGVWLVIIYAMFFAPTREEMMRHREDKKARHQ